MAQSILSISVVMITYNHEKFIKKAISGVLGQKCNNKLELIIANDNSIDATDRIIKNEIAQNTSDIIIKYKKHDRNKGVYNNFLWAMNEAKGQFIAFCEGDDYWNDEHKLAKQIKLFDAKPKLSLAFHSCYIESMFDNSIVKERPAENRLYHIDELLLTKVAHTVSFLFKKEFFNEHLVRNKNVFGADVITALMMAENGEVYGQSDYMATYRKHDGGITHQQENKLGVKHYKRFVRQFIYIKNNFPSLSRHASTIKIIDNCITVIQMQGWKKPLSNIKYLSIALFYQPQLLYKALKRFF